MKRNVQSLLLFACMVPLLVRAEEETMEERKRRITRKYLRERMDITYSEEVVPGTAAEAEEVLASEKFKQPEVDIERQQPGAQLPPPMRQPAPRTENRNWLFSKPEEPADPYADPFAPKDSKDEPKKDDWTTWGTERESSPSVDMQREDQYNWRQYDSFSGQQSDRSDSMRQEGRFNPRTSLGEGMPSGFPQQGDRSSGSLEGQDPSRGKSFDSIFNQNRIQSPFQRETGTPLDQSFRSGLQPRADGYTPYKSPYQTQREQQQEQSGGYRQPKQEYQRQDPFQQWKKNNPSQFDPTSDDAFVEEMMPKIRR